MEKSKVELDSEVDLPEGSNVCVEVEESGVNDQTDNSNDPVFRMSELAVDAGIPDLATNIDHYLYNNDDRNDAP